MYGAAVQARFPLERGNCMVPRMEDKGYAPLMSVFLIPTFAEIVSIERINFEKLIRSDGYM